MLFIALQSSQGQEQGEECVVGEEDDGDIDDDNGMTDFSQNSGIDQHESKSGSTKRPLSTNKKKRKKDDDDGQKELIMSLAKSIQEDVKQKDPLPQQDDCSSFGEHVAESLRQLDTLHRAIVMGEIQSSLTGALVSQFQD